jgi:hypothetical protein
MITKKECCCDKMYEAILPTSVIPINVENKKNNHGLYRFDMEFVDINNQEECALLDEIPTEPIDFCPFCGKNISIFMAERSDRWKTRSFVCGSFRKWFGLNKDGKQAVAPTPMFRYEPKENQFYMHYRKGFGEGWIPITYCIYCGEPLAEMVEKYGIPAVIVQHLDPSEWKDKYKICYGEKKLTKDDQLPDWLS